ncbi:CPBP family intramembrane metalloprotease [Clostridia bacterium]|nr:CPBP family intramembrane metalloprotease [Clostridia bacterium]
MLKNVRRFFIIVFMQTWICYFAILLLGLNAHEGLGMVFLICGGMAPSLIGVIMAFVTYSKEERKEFFRRFYQVKRIGVAWWAFILLIYPAIHVVALLITLISGGEMPEMELLRSIMQNPASLLPVLVINFFINGAWPEEFGWRGFALQPLLERFGFAKASFLLGTIWAVWHLPLFFMPAQGHYQMGFIGFWFFLLQSIGLSAMMSFVHTKTKQSILAVMLLHMFCNLTSNLMFSYSHTYERIGFVLVFVVGVILCVKSHRTKGQNEMILTFRKKKKPHKH